MPRQRVGDNASVSTASEPTDIWPGGPQHLGATYDGDGTNFAVWSPDATACWVCVFDDDGTEHRLQLPERTQGVWHGYVPGVRPGRRYGFRVDGPWHPRRGQAFNVDKLLLDPYARAIDGVLDPHPLVATAREDGTRQVGDDAAYVPRSSVVVAGDAFDWGDDRPPATAWNQTVIYEAHVKGLTWLHPEVPAELRGTFAGVAHPAVVGYLRDLGITALELLPVQQFCSEPFLSDLGLVNYWGYNTVGFFAPHSAYSAGGSRGQQVDEFKAMVKALHAAGIEVILDVVYNHTAEGGPGGPTLSFRGLDGSYYLQSDGRYFDVTGCGNTVNASHPQVLQLVMDSLRYWVEDMHVDGFRFDLAPALCRNPYDVDMRAPFLTAVHQDPVLRRVKLIAEPWDATGDGYRVGQFPPRWCEWNDRFRGTVRDFWRGGSGGVRDLATRFAGSSDLYADDGRLPFASVNFVTAHDGFTLRDLVSYDHKHNEANGQQGRDGTDDNRSWNCGVEGETDDPAVRSLRRRQAANLLATLVLSTGIPMITAGDECGRTQGGNNNAYCQDNETSWVRWDADKDWQHLRPLLTRLLRLRRSHPVLHQRYFFRGRPMNGSDNKDITWLRPTGAEMTGDSWDDSAALTLGVFLAGDALRATTAEGEEVTDTSYLLWLHAGDSPVDVTLPGQLAPAYAEVLRTDRGDDEGESDALWGGSVVTLTDHTFALYEVVPRLVLPLDPARRTTSR